ncbi:MAG TPA: pseudouridine synthase [Gaiellales bacterium]|nr:pseudouridine synthase [Gaiellales bacterium]
MPARLNRYLASAGLGSRRTVERLIEDGRVTVNGRPGTLASRVGEGDEVRLDGAVVVPEGFRYVILHKPAGVVTTSHDPQGRPTVIGLVRSPERLFSVGRLDADTTGALILTNDGALAERLAHPRGGVEKVYRAEVEGRPDAAALQRLAAGVELDDGATAPARARLVGPGIVELALHEGRNRQVRRMCAAVGHPVQRLHRSQYAGLTADDLEPGAHRELTAAELARLRRM